MKLADRMNHLGTETAFEVLARANALAAQGREIINLGIGQPDFQTPYNIVEAGRRHWRMVTMAIPRLMAFRNCVRRWRKISKNTGMWRSIQIT